jgi:hypothetical protein
LEVVLEPAANEDVELGDDFFEVGLGGLEVGDLGRELGVAGVYLVELGGLVAG